MRFHGLPGWRTGRSGTVREARNGDGKRIRLAYPESTAWMSNVRYRDAATTDPPQRTVYRMPRDGVVVWAAITPALAADTRQRLDLRLAGFRRGLCCDGTPPPYTREWDTAGRVASGRYDVIVRIYFGSRPTQRMLRQARNALRALELPKTRR